MVKGYCLKEKKKVEIDGPEYALNAKDRPVVRGKCSSCGGKVYAILAAADVPADLKAKLVGKKKGGASRRFRKSKTSSKGSRKSRSKRSKRK